LGDALVAVWASLELPRGVAVGGTRQNIGDLTLPTVGG
jgi:hypothetical protein